MTFRDSGKRKLSKGILEMKFMKRSKENATKEQEVEESLAMFSSQMTEKMKSGENNFVLEPSFAACEGLTIGRLSFGGMNPDIERLMQEDESFRTIQTDSTKGEMDISDAEMANAYKSSLVATVASKFMPKNQRKKTKFMKPSEED